MLKILCRARNHRHQHAITLKAVRTDANRVVSILTRKCRENDSGLTADVLNLSPVRLNAVTLCQIDKDCDCEHHVVAVILARILICRCINVNLHGSGCTCKFICICRNSV